MEDWTTCLLVPERRPTPPLWTYSMQSRPRAKTILRFWITQLPRDFAGLSDFPGYVTVHNAIA